MTSVPRPSEPSKILTQLTREVRMFVARDAAPTSREIANSWLGSPCYDVVAVPLVVRLTVERPVDPRIGYVEDIGVLDRVIRQAIDRLSPQTLQRPVEEWLTTLGGFVRGNLPSGLAFSRLELQLTPQRSFAFDPELPEMILSTRQYEFSAAHRLHSPHLSEEENRRTFGKCNNPHGHGHNYVVDICIAGQLDDATKSLLPDLEFDRRVKAHAIDRLDHKFLNVEVPEFQNENPTVEYIARVIWDWLVDKLAPAKLHRVRVYETAKTWADVGRSGSSGTP